MILTFDCSVYELHCRQENSRWRKSTIYAVFRWRWLGSLVNIVNVSMCQPGGIFVFGLGSDCERQLKIGYIRKENSENWSLKQ